MVLVGFTKINCQKYTKLPLLDRMQMDVKNVHCIVTARNTSQNKKSYCSKGIVRRSGCKETLVNEILKKNRLSKENRTPCVAF